ncbi:MAG: hypothetical protein J6S85_18385 [Methanobrevibacter sp.]|nr:hypothetical protein [Methanobrevibacter sp.]
MIKYTPEFNARIRKDVRHFNQVRKTLSKKGIEITPPPFNVSELKIRIQDRGELIKELNLLSKISSKSENVLKEVETSGGVKSIKWELDYLKANQKQAIEQFKREKEYELRNHPILPVEKMRLFEIEEMLEVMNLDVDYMNQEQFKNFKAGMKEFFQMAEHMNRGYRGFLWQVENAMRLAGYENKDINALFNKFKGLTPSQFHEYYRTNDLIKRIYELVNSDPNGNPMKLTTSEEDARVLIDTLIEEVDEDIAQIKGK